MFSRSIVTLNIEANEVRFLVARGKRILRWGSLPLAPGLVKHGLIADPAKVSLATNILFREKKLPRSGVIASLTGLRSALRIFSLPRIKSSLMAEAIRIVAALYKDGVVAKPESYEFAFPDLLTFHDAPTPIEQRLFVMFFEHRMRAFQGTFHSNPDYSLWYGWSELKRDLTEIKHMAENLRAFHSIKAQAVRSK